MLEARYEEAGEAYLDFVSAYGGARSDKRIEELILKIYEFSRSYPDPERWLGGIVEAYGAETAEELEQSAYVERIRSNVSRYLEDAEELLLLGLSICREADGPGMYEEALLLDMHMAEAMKKEETFEGLSRQMRSMKWAKLAPNRDKNVSVQKAEQVKAIREEVKTLFKDMAAQYFYEDMEGMLEDIRLCRPHIEELADLVGEFARRFEEKKREKEPELPVLNLSEDNGLTDDQMSILRALNGRTMQVDDIIDETQIPARRVLSALTVLEIDGRVTQSVGKRFALAVSLEGA